MMRIEGHRRWILTASNNGGYVMKLVYVLMVCCLFLLTLFDVVGAAEKLEPVWQYTTTEYDLRRAFTTGTAQTPDGDVAGSLTFACRSGENGSLCIEYTVAAADSIPSFNFAALEGPSAPAAGRELLTITIAGTSEEISIATSLNGWYSAEVPGGFTFGVCAKNTGQSRVGDLITALLARSGSALTLHVADPDGATVSISSTFPTEGLQQLLAQLVDGCWRHRSVTQ